MQVVLESESGLFFINSEGVLEHFEPSSNNLFVDEVTEIREIILLQPISLSELLLCLKVSKSFNQTLCAV